MLSWALSAEATYVAVLETRAEAAAKESVSESERKYLTDVLRGQAVQVLPAEQNFTIMTRENINAMLPPGKSIEECQGSCLAETGKNISADYVCQASIGKFSDKLTLTVELYETASNKLVSSFNGRGGDVEALLDIIKEKAPDFFGKAKGSNMAFGGFGGLGDFSSAGSFSYKGKKKFIVKIASTPSGAIPTVDGKAIPKCTRTPCQVELEEGNHLFVLSKDRYDDGEIQADVKANYQTVHVKLQPNFGFLVLNPTVFSSVGDAGEIRATVDGKKVKPGKLELAPGIHEVKISHPCADPVSFKAAIEKGKTEIYDKPLVRGIGGLELAAEYAGEPQVVAIKVDGKDVGTTPFSGEVPMCSQIVLYGEDWEEDVNVKLKWHDVVKVTHQLEDNPHPTEIPDDANDSRQTLAQEAAGDVEKPEASAKIRWLPIVASSAALATGVILSVVGNKQAKDAYDAGFASEEEYKSNKDKAHSGQTLRGIGLGVAVLGAIGLGFSIAF